MNAQHHPEQSCFCIKLLGIEWKKCLLDLKHSDEGLYTLLFKMLGYTFFICLKEVSYAAYSKTIQ